MATRRRVRTAHTKTRGARSLFLIPPVRIGLDAFHCGLRLIAARIEIAAPVMSHPPIAVQPNPFATIVGFGAIVLWSALALLTALSGDAPPFELAALTFAIGGLCGARLRGGARPAFSARAALAGLARRDRRPLRLSRALFRCVAPRAAGRREPHRLSLAAVDCAVFRGVAGRASARASCGGRRARFRGSGDALPVQGRRLRLGRPDGAGRATVSLLAAPSCGQATRCCRAASKARPTRGGRRLLPRHGGARRPLSCGLRDDGRPIRRGAMACNPWPWTRAGRPCLLRLGLWGQARRHSHARRRRLCRAGPFDARFWSQPASRPPRQRWRSPAR